MSSRGIDRDSTVSVPYDLSGVGSSRLNERVGDEQETSPIALTAALDAFQKFGAQRKRAMTNGTLERDRERERELQEEMQRQKRIREKVPGRKVNGRTKTMGNIDGMFWP